MEAGRSQPSGHSRTGSTAAGHGEGRQGCGKEMWSTETVWEQGERVSTERGDGGEA